MDAILQNKYQKLTETLERLGGVAVGYSGGIDSTLLAKVAHDTLGERALPVMAVSESYPMAERQEALKIASELGLDVIEVHTDELAREGYRQNQADRCAHCKTELTEHLLRVAEERGVPHIAIGVNVDDLGDYRPGQAAAKSLGAVLPMVEAGLTKADVRALSQETEDTDLEQTRLRLPLFTFPVWGGNHRRKLGQIEAAEDVLRVAGFKQFRVRYHREVARIEIPPEEFQTLIERREEIAEKIRATGFLHVAVDLLGFRSGSMNEALQIKEPALLQIGGLSDV